MRPPAIHQKYTAQVRSLSALAPAWVWLAALLPRCVLCVLAWNDPQRFLRADAVGYLALARNIVLHGAFSSLGAPSFTPDTFRTPGYPVFLAPFIAVFPNPILPIAAAQCFLSALNAALIWRWLNDAWGRRAAAVGSMAVALDLVTIFHAPILISETLFLLLMTLATVQTWRSLSRAGPLGASFCGLLWGASAMVRPISLYLPIFLGWIWRRDRKALAVFFLCAYLLPGLWVLRNWEATGVPAFTSVGGMALIRYTAACVESLRTGRSSTEYDVELRQNVDRLHPGGYDNDAEQGRYYQQAAVKILASHPLLLARFCAMGTVKILGGTGLEMLLEWTGTRYSSDGAFRPRVTGQGTLALLRAHPSLIPLQAGYMAALMALYLAALAGWRRLWINGKKAQAVFLTVCTLYLLGLSSTQGYYRYRIPMMPFLGAGAAAFMAPVRRPDANISALS